MRRLVAAALVAFVSLILPAFGAEPPLTLAALNPDDLSPQTGKARQLNLGDLEVSAPNGAQMLKVNYEIYLGGFHLAAIDIVAIVDHGHYVAGTLLSTKGLADAFVSSNIQAVSTGEVHGHVVIPHSYNSDLKSPDNHQLVGLLFGSDGPTSIDSNPPYDLTRFPVSDQQKRNTVDPLSAALFISLGSSVDDQDKCGRTVPIFDGKRRYDLKFSFVSNDKISLGRDSFNGGKPVPALLCRALYQRVAGFKPSKSGREPRIPPINVWLAPYPGTDFMVPMRMETSTDFGGVVARATKLAVVAPGSHT